MKIIYIYIVTALLILAYSGCEETKNVPPVTDEKLRGEQPDQISWNVDVIFVDSSFTKAILKAGRARVYQNRLETLLDSSIRVDFMSRASNKRVSLLTADSARIDDKTKDMLASGHVIVIADSSGRRLETSLLLYSNKTQKLYSTEYVKITSPNESITGYGFESDPNLTNYKIFKVSGIQR